MLKLERLGAVLTPEDALHAKFNAGALLSGGEVHLLYRYGEIKKPSGGRAPKYIQNGIAYARMSPEGQILYDSGKYVVEKTHKWEKKGLEDPRIFTLEGKIYITYTAFDGRRARVAFAEANADFTEFKKIGIVPARKFDKDAFLFPERINGKIAYVHRFEPNIQIDYFDSLEELFDKAYWKKYKPSSNGSVALAAEQDWENGKLGGSVPPIKTELGWLFVYHGVGCDREPFCYRAGLALLDLRDPHKILARLPYPILEPEEDYEVRGDVNNVVFPCGGYIYGEYLYIVYGGADKVTALARCPVGDALSELKRYMK